MYCERNVTKWCMRLHEPWRRLGRIPRGRCRRASRVPRGSIAAPGPWLMDTARWCPPEKRGDSSIRFERRRRKACRIRSGRGGRDAMKAAPSTRTRFNQDAERQKAEAGGSHAVRAGSSSFPFSISRARASSSELPAISYRVVERWFSKRRNSYASR